MSQKPIDTSTLGPIKISAKHTLKSDNGWFDIADAPRDGTDIVILAHGMEIEARYCPFVDKVDHEGIDASEGACWCAFDDLTQFEVEELNSPDGTAMYFDGQVTHWRPKHPLPSVPNLPS